MRDSGISGTNDLLFKFTPPILDIISLPVIDGDICSSARVPGQCRRRTARGVAKPISVLRRAACPLAVDSNVRRPTSTPLLPSFQNGRYTIIRTPLLFRNLVRPDCMPHRAVGAHFTPSDHVSLPFLLARVPELYSQCTANFPFSISLCLTRNHVLPPTLWHKLSAWSTISGPLVTHGTILFILWQLMGLRHAQLDAPTTTRLPPVP